MNIRADFKGISECAYFFSKDGPPPGDKDLEKKVGRVARYIKKITPEEMKSLPLEARCAIIECSLATHEVARIDAYIDDVLASRLMSNSTVTPENKQALLARGWHYDDKNNTLVVTNKSLTNDAFQQIFRDLPDRLKATTEAVDMSGCSNLEKLSDLRDCKALKKLVLQGCSKLCELEHFEQLEYLNIKGCFGLTNLSSLGAAKKLETVIAENCKKLRTIEALHDKPALKHVNIAHCHFLNNSALKHLRGAILLEDLNLSGLSGFTDVSYLSGLKNLRSLTITSSSITDTSSLSHVEGLTIIR